MKNKYTVTIEETLSSDFEVYANNSEEAIELAIKKYRDGELVLEPGNLMSKKIAITFPNKDCEWLEF